MRRVTSKRELFAVLRRDPEYVELIRRDPELAEILRRDPMACKRNLIRQCGGCGVHKPDTYQSGEIKLSAGDSHWSTEDGDDESTPYCNVGGWDNGDFWDVLDESLGKPGDTPTRQTDCWVFC